MLASSHIQRQADITNVQHEIFKRSLEAPIVLLDLEALKSGTDDLITALEEKIDAQYTGYVALGGGVIDEAFENAITIYSSL